MSIGICSLPFLLFAVVLTVVFHLCPARRGRRAVLIAANVAVLVALVPDRQSGVWLVLFVAASYAALRFLKARPTRDHLIAAVGLTVLAFLYLKRYTFLHALLPAGLWPEVWLRDVEVIGLSFMLFKYIHMAVDQSQDQLAAYTFLGYANYQLSFFTLVAGPIQRYNDFHFFWNDMGLGAASGAASEGGPGVNPAGDALRAWVRLLTGMLKTAAVSSLLLHQFQDAGLALEATNAQASPGLLRHFAVYFYAYPFYMYFNFSGYTDMMIGAAGLLGHRLPENFNHPFLARNVIDYWNRWHIRLTHWVRDYVFMASYKKVAQRFGARGRAWGYFLLFFSLLLTGVWHGSTSAFFAFGLLHGLGAAVNRGYGDWLKSRLGRAGLQRYEKNPLARAAAVLLTFHFVALCFLFFSSGTDPALRILRLASARVLASPAAALAHLPRDSSPLPSALALTCALALLTMLAAVWKRGGLRMGLMMGHGGFFGPAFPTRAGVMKPLLVAWPRRRAGRLTAGVRPLYLLVAAEAAAVVLVFLVLWAIEGRGPVVEYMRF